MELLGGAALLLSFALLSQRRIAALINITATQATVLAIAACWQASVRHAPQLYLTGALVFAAQGVIIPRALHRFLHRRRGRAETAPGIFPSLALGVALVALSIMVVLPTASPSQPLTREDLALALSVVLLGLLMMISRHTTLARVIGFMSLQNGLILAAINVDGLPLAVELSAGALALAAFAVFDTLHESADR